MLALKLSSSGLCAAVVLEHKGLKHYGVKFFLGFIRQTGLRRCINASNGEPAMKALEEAAAQACERVE